MNRNTTVTNRLTEDVFPSLQGVIPSSMVTSSLLGVPNNMAVSQVFYVDETHVAVSNQFLNKTKRNIQENPVVCVIITCPVEYILRKLILRYVESQDTGEIFENMKLQLEVIAGMQHKEGVFSLLSADIYELISIETLK